MENPKNGIITYIWGPPLWMFLHIISFNYPLKPSAKEKKEYYDFILSLKSILPCKYCRENVVKNLKDISFSKSDMKNRETFSKAIYKLHNKVNKMLGKKKYKTYKEIANIYEGFRATCDPNISKTKLEKGCKKALYKTMAKPKCQINVIPNGSGKSMKINKKCIRK
jgi:hypothetical protein